MDRLSRRVVAVGALATSALAVAGCARSGIQSAASPGGPSTAAGLLDGSTTTAGAASAGASGSAVIRPDVTKDRALHTALRLTYGLVPNLVDHVRQVGAVAFLEEQLAARTPAELTKAYDLVDLRAEDVDLTDQAQRNDGVSQFQMSAVWRQVASPAQLYEQMVEFWSNHFAIYLLDGPQRLLKLLDDREVIRPHALGKFADLLAASAHSPAMLQYLDNFQSTKGNLNENYGRELLELHTVGVDGGYSEADVLATAKVFTGWGVGKGRAVYQFAARSHDDSPQTVMTWKSPAGKSGEAVGDDLLAYLARHPATARFLARKLLVRFVSDDPEPSYVDAVAKAYLAADTDISATLRALVNDERFFTTATAKYRRPNEFLVAMLRATAGQVVISDRKAANQGFRRLIESLGQAPLSWPAPNGFPDVAGAWQNAGGLLTRWNAAGDVLANVVAAIRIDPGALGSNAANPTATVDALALRFFGAPADAATRDAVVAGASAGDRNRVLATIAALLVASPRFHYR